MNFSVVEKEYALSIRDKKYKTENDPISVFEGLYVIDLYYKFSNICSRALLMLLENVSLLNFCRYLVQPERQGSICILFWCSSLNDVVHDQNFG